MKIVDIFLYVQRKHSITFKFIMLRMAIFALQNIKIGLWQAVKILKGYLSFTIRNEYATESESALFTIQIKSTTGMYFQQKHIDYKSLKNLVEKMEVLCLR